MSLNPQFGLATLWRKRRHRFTPTVVKEILGSARFQNRLAMWKLIHDLGSNTKSRFEATKCLRSHDGGLTMTYALRRLACNIQEPFRTMSIQAIDTTIAWWKGKPPPKAAAIRLPWSLSPDLERTVSRFLRQWFQEVIAHQVPCRNPSFKVLFIKHQAVLDIICNHKAAMTDWSLGTDPACCCQQWSAYRPASLNPTSSQWVLSGALLAPLLPDSLRPLCSGSLLNKVFPSKRDYSRQMSQCFRRWARMNGLPSIPTAKFQELIDTLWSQHKTQITSHLTKSTISQLQDLFPGAIFHCEDKHASSLRIFCPVLYFEAIDKTFMDPQVFVNSEDTPAKVADNLLDVLKAQYGRSYPWAIGRGRQAPSGYILSKAKKEYRSGRPIISFVDAPFRPMLNILARMLYQLIPVGCPHHFAVGDVYELLAILKSIPENQPLRLFNQDLAGFFTSIEPDRFFGAWKMLLDFLRPKMNVNKEEVFSVYPGKSNQPGDLIKGHTFRRLNVTRKITIVDVPSLLTTALDMQTFALGGRCIKQRRISPMGSPLSSALCLIVVSISEEIWYRNFQEILSNDHLFVRHIPYVDNRLLLGDPKLVDMPPYETLLDEGFYGRPILLETELPGLHDCHRAL
eukprot:s1366_g21.t1